MRLFSCQLHVVLPKAPDQLVFLLDLSLLAADLVEELPVLRIKDFVLGTVKLHQPLVVVPLKLHQVDLLLRLDRVRTVTIVDLFEFSGHIVEVALMLVLHLCHQAFKLADGSRFLP